LKLRKIVLCAVSAGILLISSCTQEPAVSVPSELQLTKETEKPSLEPNEDNFPIITDDYRNYIKKANIVKGSDPISYKNVEYSNIKIAKSKELLYGIKKEDVDYMNDGMKASIGEDGSILDDNTYLFVTTQITNKTNEELLVPLQIRVVELDKELSYKGCSIITIYRSNNPLSSLKDKKNYYMQYFKPRESTVYTIATIVNDKVIDATNLYFILEGYYTDSDRQEANFEFEEDKAYKIN